LSSTPSAQKQERGPAGFRTGDTVDKVADALKEQILDGRLAPGQRLISKDLAEWLGVSRGSLREAFRRLAADRLVELVPNRGAIVRRLDRAEIIRLFQIREALEGQAARLAALHIDDGDHRKKFEQIVAEGKQLQGQRDMRAFVDHNHRFHQAVVAISDNPELAQLIDRYQLAVFMSLLRQVVGTDKLIDDSLKQHADIARAILARDPDAAYEAMKRHLWHSADGLLAAAKPL
jgi:DNA-binding GntR family transcriptional regulator